MVARAPELPEGEDEVNEQQDRAKWWNAERTGEPCKLHCCRCGERVRAHHNGVDGGAWFVHSRCADKPASHQESVIQ